MKYLVVLLLAGCLDKLEPSVGMLTHEPCGNVDSNPSHDESFANDVVPIMKEYHCAKCHTPGGMTPIGFVVGGLDLTSYDTLRAGGSRSMAQIVIPGNACSSILYQKLEPGPPYGSRMPLDGPEYLGDDDLTVISDWIIEGAHDN